jgi:hypothetical protein
VSSKDPWGDKRDPTRRPVPINPPERSSQELWASYNFQCNIAAGLSGGPIEKDLTDQNNDKHPSEVERMKKATEEPKK